MKTKINLRTNIIEASTIFEDSLQHCIVLYCIALLSSVHFFEIPVGGGKIVGQGNFYKVLTKSAYFDTFIHLKRKKV